MKKVLSIVDTAYRATLEEQDDAALWFSHACYNSGLNLDILLTGNAVNYAVKEQNPQALTFGFASIPKPNCLHEDLLQLTQSGARLFYVIEDRVQRGIRPEVMISTAEGISRFQLAEFLESYEHVWHW